MFLDFLFFLIIITELFILLILFTMKSLRLNKSIKYLIPVIVIVLLNFFIKLISIGEVFLDTFLVFSILTSITLVLGIQDKTQLFNCIYLSLIGMFLTSIIPLILYPEMIGTRLISVGSRFFLGSFWNYPLLSFIAAAWIGLAIAGIDYFTKLQKVIIYTSFLITWVASFSGLSRTFVLVTIIGVITYLISIRNFKALTNVIAITILFLIIINLFDDSYLDHLLLRLESLSRDNIGDESRIFIWKGFLNNVDKYFWWGALVDSNTLGPSGYYTAPHSVYLNWLVKFGIFGLLSYLYMIFGCFKSINFIKKYNLSMYGYLMAWLLSYLVVVTINESGFKNIGIFAGISYVLLLPMLYKKNITSQGGYS